MLLLLVNCAGRPEPHVADSLSGPEIWVDAFATPSGDGSSARPFKQVPRPVPVGSTIRLRSGLYAGPFMLSAGTRFEGMGEVVLTGEAGEIVVTAENARLIGVSIQGGDVGLSAGASVTVSRAHFSGQRRFAAVVHGQLNVSESQFKTSVEGADGIAVDPGAELQLKKVNFVGGARRAVSTKGGMLTLETVTAQGVKTLVHAVDATSRLHDIHSSGGSGPALFFSGGRLEFQGGTVLGHEYAVQLTKGVDAHVSGLEARNSKDSCFSAVGSHVRLSKASLSHCGSNGALILLESETALSELTISSVQELGILIRKGRATLASVHIDHVTGADGLGDALHIRDATVTGEDVSVSDVGGSALFASAYANVEFRRLEVDRAGQSALFVERGSKVNIGTVRAHGPGTAIVVPDEASLEINSLSLTGSHDIPIYAECKKGARVSLKHFKSAVQQPPTQCVTGLQ